MATRAQELKHIIIVAGTNHRNIATILGQQLLKREMIPVVFTRKSDIRRLKEHISMASHLIWLVSPQTMVDRWYVRLRKYTQAQHLNILPIILEPVSGDLPFSQPGIKLGENVQTTTQLIVNALNIQQSPLTSQSRWKAITMVFYIFSRSICFDVCNICVYGIFPTRTKCTTNIRRA